MEKFSKFKDPLTGINPFIAPEIPSLNFMIVLKAILNFPLYILYLLGLPVVNLLFKIKKNAKEIPKGLIYSNSVTEFDKEIIKNVLKIKIFGKFKNQTCVYFPENTNTNNRAILKYDNKEECNYVIGLKYSSNCIYLYGNRLFWLLNFLGNERTVEVVLEKGNNLKKAANLPESTFGSEDKLNFMKLIEQENKKNQ